MLKSYDQQNISQLERRCWQLHSFLGFLQAINQGAESEIEHVERLQTESERVKFEVLTSELDSRLDALLEL